MNANKPVVLCLDVHPPEVQAIFEAETPPEVTLRTVSSYSPAEATDLAAEADFFIGGWAPMPAALIEAAPRLRLVQKWGIGVDKIDLEAARRRGIPVAITAGANAVPVADLTLLLMLAVLRHLPRLHARLQAGEWLKAEARSYSYTLRGKVVGLVGLGHIGREVARRVRAFDAVVRYFDVRRLSPDDEQAVGVTYRPLDDVLAEADVVSLHVPLIEATRGILSRERISRLKPTAIVVNTARGGLIDEPALAEALREGRLLGAGIDVFSQEPPPPDHPLLHLDRVVTTPHIGGAAFDNVAHVTRHAFANVLRVLRGEPLAPTDIIVPPAGRDGGK